MKHKILFIRHNRLAGKYAHYNTLAFSELRELGLNIGFYAIDTENYNTSLDTNGYQKCLTSL